MEILIFEDQREEAGRWAGETATPLVTASMWQLWAMPHQRVAGL